MKPWVIPAVLVFALLAFVFGAVFMPAAELMPAQVTQGSWMPGLSPVRDRAVMNIFGDIAAPITGFFLDKGSVKEAMTKPMQDGIPGEVRSYVLYAICLSLAMVFSAIAFNLVNRWDSEEKTIIPTKK